MMGDRLVLFDLDHTLLSGDSDELWCEFLMARGLLDRADFGPRNAAMVAAYQRGEASVQDFSGFYVATLAGRTVADWSPLREAFLAEAIVPRLGAPARALLKRHQDQGDLVVMTTATNRFITELTAAHLGIVHLIATECGFDAEGRFTGRPHGTVNMREGKVQRLHDWLAARGQSLAALESWAYSDSINDLPLLEAARRPHVVDPDARLAAVAAARGWPLLNLHPRDKADE